MPLGYFHDRLVALEIAGKAFMQRLAGGDALVEILQYVPCQRDGIIIDELQALVCPGSIFLWMDVHHMPLQFFVVKGKLHAEADNGTFQ